MMDTNKKMSMAEKTAALKADRLATVTEHCLRLRDELNNIAQSADAAAVSTRELFATFEDEYETTLTSEERAAIIEAL